MIPSSTPSFLIDEDARRRFEAAWTAGRPEPIEHFLPPEDDACYLSTLEELVAIELEYRWKSARPPLFSPEGSDGDEVSPTFHSPRLEGYLARFPRLDRPEIVRRLEEEMERVRQRYGPAPNQTQPASRFPVLGAERLGSGEEPPTRVPGDEMSQTRDLPGRRRDKAVEIGPAIPGYEIMGELGRGGMGVVYQARQTSLKRIVALKMIRAAGDAGAEERARFRSEAEAVAHLQHANIVQVYEIGEHDGCPFFSLEFIEGGSLAARLKETPPRAAEAARLAEDLARAAHYAHQRGIVHRDLKPANILLTADGTPKITDFGLAKHIHQAGDWTRTGAIMGTPRYMAPEQAAGQSRAVGPGTDVYALGVILYEMLTGLTPFRGDSVMDVLQQVRTQEPIQPSRLQPRVPRDLETICLKCLQKEPHRRYASALELADDLGRFRDGQPIQARPVGLVERSVKWARRRPAAAALLAAAVALVGLIIGYNAYLQYALEEKRLETVEANRRTSLSELRGKARDILAKGESEFSNRRYDQALQLFKEARSHVAQEPDAADLREQAEQRVRETTPFADNLAAVNRDHNRLEQFRSKLGEALYREALVSGIDASENRQAAQTAAEDALRLFGITIESPKAPALDGSFYLVPERAEITAGCFQLLLIVAEAVAGAAANLPESERAAPARKAQAVLDLAAAIGPDTQALHMRRSRCLEMLGQSEAADQERARAQAMQPVGPLDHFLAGIEHHRQGKSREAEPLFEQALRLQPDHFWAQYFLAVCQLQRNQPAQARSNLTVCLGRRPDFLWAYVLRGFTHVELKDYASAARDFDEALKRTGTDAEARYAVLVHRGVLRLRQEQLALAEQDLQEAVKLRPRLYQAHVNLAQVFLQAGHGAEALAAMDRAIELQPDLAALYRSRARLRLQIQSATPEERRKNEAAALSDLDQAIARSPAQRDDHIERGWLLLRAQRFGDAKNAADKALEPDDGHAQANRLLGQAQLELHEYKEAAAAFERALTRDPKGAVAWRGRAAALVRLGDFKAAVECYNQAQQLQPEDASTYMGRGWARVAARAYRLAVDDFTEALQKDSRSAYALSGRGYAQVRLGKHREAVVDTEMALGLEPASAALLHAAARTFALAVQVLDTDAAPQANLRLQYQGRALDLIQRALEAVPAKDRQGFWKQTLGSDPDFKAIRRSTGFINLIAQYGQPGEPKTPGK